MSFASLIFFIHQYMSNVYLQDDTADLCLMQMYSWSVQSKLKGTNAVDIYMTIKD